MIARIIADGVLSGAVLCIAALGLSHAIFRFPNFAHSEYLTAGAYGALVGFGSAVAAFGQSGAVLAAAFVAAGFTLVVIFATARVFAPLIAGAWPGLDHRGFRDRASRPKPHRARLWADGTPARARSRDRIAGWARRATDPDRDRHPLVDRAFSFSRCISCCGTPPSDDVCVRLPKTRARRRDRHPGRRGAGAVAGALPGCAVPCPVSPCLCSGRFVPRPATNICCRRSLP